MTDALLPTRRDSFDQDQFLSILSREDALETVRSGIVSARAAQ